MSKLSTAIVKVALVGLKSRDHERGTKSFINSQGGINIEFPNGQNFELSNKEIEYRFELEITALKELINHYRNI